MMAIERHDQTLRDNALHLYGDMFRAALNLQQSPDSATIRLELFALSLQLNSIIQHEPFDHVHNLQDQFDYIEWRFNNLGAYNLVASKLLTIRSRVDTAQAKVAWHQTQREEIKYHRLEMHKAAEDLRLLLVDKQPNIQEWNTAVENAKQRITYCANILAKLDRRALAVSFLGIDLAQANFDAIDIM